MQSSTTHERAIRRFTEACHADDRVLACFLGGSIARGAADVYSDLDLYLITTQAGYESFWAERAAFLALLGEPLFVEDFDLRDIVFFVLANGVEGELGIGKAGEFSHIHSGPYTVLVDKTGILANVSFSEPEPDAHVESVRRLIHWFWHDLSHFITAMGRGQLWWAYGQLEILRAYCIKLARLQNDFSDGDAWDEPYFKIEQAIPVDWLEPLRVTFCPMEFKAMLYAGSAILTFYRDLAPLLAQTHGIAYPRKLEALMVKRLENLGSE